MGIGISIFLIAAGAILAFAVEVEVSGLDLATVGWILMVVGGLGLLAALTIFGPRRRQMVSGTPMVAGTPMVTGTPVVGEVRERTDVRDEY